MIDLALAIACGLAIGMIFKHAARIGVDRVALLTVNYAAASLLSGAALLLGQSAAAGGLSAELVVLAVTTGVLFILGFFMLALATAVAGMSLATAVMRISVVIPFLASWVIWNETPSAYQAAGLAVAGAAFFMISHRRSSPDRPASIDARPPVGTPEPSHVFAVLAVLFLVGGAVDTLMKTFDEVFADGHGRAGFMTLVFGVAFAVGVVVSNVRRRSGFDGAAAGWGLLLGAVNFGSVEFILQAIHALSGPFVFPANNIGLVIGGAVLGVWIWNEELSALNWTGLALAAAALILLNL